MIDDPCLIISQSPISHAEFKSLRDQLDSIGKQLAQVHISINAANVMAREAKQEAQIANSRTESINTFAKRLRDVEAVLEASSNPPKALPKKKEPMKLGVSGKKSGRGKK